MTQLCYLCTLIVCLLILPTPAAAELYVTIIQGLPGAEEYAARFNDQTKILREAAARMTQAGHVKVLSGDQATRKNILAHGKTLRGTVTAGDRVAVYLVGHGSYDGHDYKFNIPGPDLTGADLADLMNNWQARAQLLVATSSASGAILKGLQRDGRVVITATRSGNERNAPLFGGYFTEALRDAGADTDKNDAISAAEAYAYAERLTKDFYQGAGRLATEHPQMQGDKGEQFQLTRLTQPVSAAASPALARLQQLREELDQELAALRARKDQYRDNNEYQDALQALILKLAAIDDRIEALTKDNADGPAPE